MKYLGVDYGKKRTGIALSDDEGRLAFPHATIETTRTIVRDIAALAKGTGATVFVVGSSIDLAGADNPIMRDIRAFGADLRAFGEVFFEDERLSTRSAMRSPAKGAPTQKKDDASAAAIILQSFLDRRNARPSFADPYALNDEADS